MCIFFGVRSAADKLADKLGDKLGGAVNEAAGTLSGAQHEAAAKLGGALKEAADSLGGALGDIQLSATLNEAADKEAGTLGGGAAEKWGDTLRGEKPQPPGGAAAADPQLGVVGDKLAASIERGASTIADGLKGFRRVLRCALWAAAGCARRFYTCLG